MNQRDKLANLIWEYDYPQEYGYPQCDYPEMADRILAAGFVDLSHINLIELEEDYRSIQISKVVLFNSNLITQEEALRVVKSGEQSPFVLVMYKSQWEAIFLNKSEPSG